MNYIKSINEYRYQLEIPFDGKDPLYDKPEHINVLDAIKQMAINTKKDVNKFKSNEPNLDYYFNKHKDDAMERFANDDATIESLDLGYYLSNWFDEDDMWIETDGLEDMDDWELYNNLSSDGLVLYDNFIIDRFYECLDEFDFMWYIKNNQNDKGLVRIWRAMTISKGKFKDEFENMISYGGVGYYWSWAEEGAIAHGGFQGNTYIISGWVRPENINWVETIYKNAWSLRDEMEIEVGQCNILIDGVYLKKSIKYGKTQKILISDEKFIVES
jgi:hypothetical protein